MSRSLDKSAVKKQALVVRTANALNISLDEATQLLSTPRNQSIRINTLLADKIEIIDTLQTLGWEGEQYPWFVDGLTIIAGLDSLKASDFVNSGKIYIQNAASWLPVIALNAQPGDEVLDVCAAPGGKTSHIAAYTYNAAKITANDNSRPRLARMRTNLERLNVQNVEYTLYEASQLSRKLHGKLYDKILLDAPCSGEGMMNLNNDKDFQYWSVAQIKRLQQLQKKIITQAWQLLKPSGTLIYSTCTMAPEENEAVIDYLLRRNEDAKVISIAELKAALPNVVNCVLEWNGKQYNSNITAAARLKPHSNIEAFFVCKLNKKLDEQ